MNEQNYEPLNPIPPYLRPFGNIVHHAFQSATLVTCFSLQVGIEAWKNARDSTGSTPEDYARLRGHYTYVHLVQKKINKRQGGAHVVVEIPSNQTECNTDQKQKQIESLTGFEIGKAEVKRGQGHCKLCDTKISCRTAVGRSMVYRPAMLSMVAIAAVCVCVALLFKSSPEVLYMFRPFRWESLDFGTS